MEKSDCAHIELGTGSIDVYDFGDVKLHAFRTADPIDDEVFVVEQGGRGFVIEYPCFFDGIRALEGYLSDTGIAVEGIVAAYHMAGASFLAGTPVLPRRRPTRTGMQGAEKPSSTASRKRSERRSTAPSRT